MTSAVGLDLSLSGAGVARADWIDPPRLGSHTLDNPRVRHCRIGSPPTTRDLADRALRLRSQAAQIIALCDGADLVAVEAPLQGMKSTGSSHDRSGLWWLVVARLCRDGIPVVEVTNSQLKLHALGKGGGKDTGKDAVLAAVVRRWAAAAPTLQTNDEADALVLADMAARRLGCPLTELPQSHLRAMGTVPWPIPQKGAPA